MFQKFAMVMVCKQTDPHLKMTVDSKLGEGYWIGYWIMQLLQKQQKKSVSWVCIKNAAGVTIPSAASRGVEMSTHSSSLGDTALRWTQEQQELLSSWARMLHILCFDVFAFKRGRLLSRQSADLLLRSEADVQIITQMSLHVLHAKNNPPSHTG